MVTSSFTKHHKGYMLERNISYFYFHLFLARGVDFLEQTGDIDNKNRSANYTVLLCPVAGNSYFR